MTIKSGLAAASVMVIGWLSILGLVTMINDAAPAFVVLFPDAELFESLSQQTRILSATQVSVTLASDELNFARSLYAKGAILVLPAGLTGCG